MSEAITQTRLSTRLETYLSEYTGKYVTRDAPSNAEWDTAWRVADRARTQNTLTPELVDDVRQALKKLESITTQQWANKGKPGIHNGTDLA